MRAFGGWYLTLTLCAAALFAGERRVFSGDTARSLDATVLTGPRTAGEANGLDADATLPAPSQVIGPRIAIGGMTSVTGSPAARESAGRHSSSRPGGATLLSIRFAPRASSLLLIPLRI